MFLTWILDTKFGFVVAVVITITTIILHYVFRSKKAAAMISHAARIVEQVSRGLNGFFTLPTPRPITRPKKWLNQWHH